jgi:polyisoprenoid-binding protein YceI
MAERNGGAAGTVDLQAVLPRALGHWVLDPSGSAVSFHVKHFWGAITVDGHFEQLEGEGTVAADGTISGRIEIETSSLTTGHRKRDTHLRSADFFDVEHHPKVVLSAEGLAADGPAALRGPVSLEAAGQSHDFEATVDIVAATDEAVTLRSELVVDRTVYGMTWSPLGMAARRARGVVTARFIRENG